jgi:hypothetical protein
VRFETREKYIRTGVRVNARTALSVEWTEEGKTLRAEGYTVDISPKGCMAVIPQGFTVGKTLRVTHLANQAISDATVAWRGSEVRTGWELGLQLQDPPEDFWGLEF